VFVSFFLSFLTQRGAYQREGRRMRPKKNNNNTTTGPRQDTNTDGHLSVCLSACLSVCRVCVCFASLCLSWQTLGHAVLLLVCLKERQKERVRSMPPPSHSLVSSFFEREREETNTPPHTIFALCVCCVLFFFFFFLFVLVCFAPFPIAAKTSHTSCV